ncbi:hypothetical protein POX_e06196 [Penicillium oxalicum]|uniref:hypothetical protein n=1 Tax=Penicillium oxalicum TaxID=69781 RepID=UPI0020B6B4CF|nr:hypothetical protein POX_e06196 [Penicillium oxalicum]KAI2788183.1 hypothetical protein POX_e06196 [Penicillium oxalicum]
MAQIGTGTPGGISTEVSETLSMPQMTEITAQATISAPEAYEMSREQWVGLTDRAERRRIQNRINQRARRMRQRMHLRDTKDNPPKIAVSTTSSSHSSQTSSSRSPSASSFSPTTLVHVPRATSNSSPQTSPTPVELASTRTQRPGCPPTSLTRSLIHQFAEAAVRSYMLGSPTSDHLLTLTKMNVFRAFGRNIRIIGWDLDSLHDEDAISPFSLSPALLNQKEYTPTFSFDSTDTVDTEYSNLPVSLRPTHLQRSTPHHPWLDFFPLPKMRDNLIQAGDDWDDHALCHDIMGFWDSESLSTPGLIVWGDPWDIRNWELTEAFLKKWQWIVRGCPEIMEATNSWRSKRGEKLILRYI